MRKLKKYKPTVFKAPGSVYDKGAADYAVSFIEALCHTKGSWAGKPFDLIDWQEQIMRDLFGTIKPNGYRQFNTAYKKRYEGMVERYETAKGQLDGTNEEIQERKVKRECITRFIGDLAACDGLLNDFDEPLWFATVNTMTINETTAVFTFKDGTVIETEL